MSDARDVEFDGAPKPETLDGCFVRVSPLSGRPLYPHRLSRCFVIVLSSSVSLSQISPADFPKPLKRGVHIAPSRSGSVAVPPQSVTGLAFRCPFLFARSSPLPIEWKPRRAVRFSSRARPVPVPRPFVCVYGGCVEGGFTAPPPPSLSLPFLTRLKVFNSNGSLA